MTSRVILMVGCAGSGKSTYVRHHFPDASIVSADHYFEDLASDSGESFSEVWDLRSLGTAHRVCQQNFVEAIAAGDPIVVVDNTNVSASDRQRFVKKSTEHGYEVEIHVLSLWLYGAPQPSSEQEASYVSHCHGRNIHGVPLDVIANQFRRLDLPSGVYRAGKPPEFIRPCLIARETGHDEA